MNKYENGRKYKKITSDTQSITSDTQSITSDTQDITEYHLLYSEISCDIKKCKNMDKNVRKRTSTYENGQKHKKKSQVIF